MCNTNSTSINKKLLKAGDLIISPKGTIAILQHFGNDSNRKLGLKIDGSSMMLGLLPLSSVAVPIVKVNNYTLNIEDWERIFEPIQNQFSNENIDHFETYGEELEFVQTHKDNQIWTLIDGNDGKLYIEAGYHLCNRVHYFVTKNTWSNKNLVVCYE